MGWLSGRRREASSLALVIPDFVLLSALPLGSNRPFFWMANAVATGLLGLAVAADTGRVSRRRRTPILVPALLFGAVTAWVAIQAAAGYLAAAGLPTPVASPVPPDSLAMAVRLTTAGCLFLVALEAFDRGASALLGLGLLFAAGVAEAVAALLSLIQLGDTILLLPKWAYGGYATGTFVNRNHLASFLAAAAAIGSALLAREMGRAAAQGRRGVLLRLATTPAPAIAAGLAIILTAVFGSGSRMGLFVTLVGALAAAALMLPPTRPGRLAAFAGATVVLAALAAHSVLGDGMVERLGSLDRDTDVRLDLYAQTLELIGQAPIAGHGAGGFAVAFQTVLRPPVSLDRVWSAAHDTYLELAAEIGLPATAALLASVGLLLAACAGGLRRAEDRVPMAAALAVGLVMALHALVDFSLQIQANALLLAAVLGLAVARSLPRRAPAGRTEAAPTPAVLMPAGRRIAGLASGEGATP